MTSGSNSGEDAEEFPPEKRLEAPNHRLIEAGIATITDMDTLRDCVAYENSHQNRTHILKQLERRAAELQEEGAEP
jgi:hypothetical protein